MSVALALALTVVSQAPGPDQPGPYMVSTAANVMVTVAGRQVSVDVYTPADRSGAPYPVVIIGHGFARTNDNVAGHAAHLAAWGMVVVAPDFPNRFLPDHALNGRIMRELRMWAQTGPAPIGAIADARRSAYVGHSAGGLAAFLAAGGDPAVTAVVGLDPVDNANAGVGAAPSITAHTLVLAAAPDRCNSNGSATPLYGALGMIHRWFLRVTDATHCDGEDPSNSLCTNTCGGEDPARRTLFRRYMTAHLRAAFGCESLDWTPGGAVLAADLAAGGVGDLDVAGAFGCTASPDGGMAPLDAGPVADAATVFDAGLAADDAASSDALADDAAAPAGDAALAPSADAEVAPDAAVVVGDASASASDGGAASVDSGPPLQRVPDEGCSCSASRSPTGVVSVVALLALVWAARRRR